MNTKTRSNPWACKNLVNKMTNIKSFEDYSFQYESQKLELLNRAFAERKRVVEILIEHSEEGLRNFDSIRSDKFEDLTHHRDEVLKEFGKLKVEFAHKAREFAVKMLQNGVRFEEVKTALEYAKNDEFNVYNPLKFVLENAYTCKLKYLGNVVKFTHGYSWTGFPIILEKMKTCEQIDEPIIIEIAQLYKDDKIESYTDKAYEKLAKRIQLNETDGVVETLKNLKADEVDLAKIVRFSYDGDTKNFIFVTNFIEMLGNQKLEEVLYNEMIKNEHEDTKEHVMFGVFIRKLVGKAHKASDNTHLHYLEEVKNRLPEGIRNLCFSKAIYFMADDKSTFGKPSGYKAKTFSGGKLFQFEKNDQAGNFLYAGTDNYRTIPVHGVLKNHDAFYWKIKPIEKGKYFQVVNAANNFSLNTAIYRDCIEFHRKWYGTLTNECKTWSSYYLLRNSQVPPQKLMIIEA